MFTKLCQILKFVTVIYLFSKEGQSDIHGMVEMVLNTTRYAHMKYCLFGLMHLLPSQQLWSCSDSQFT